MIDWKKTFGDLPAFSATELLKFRYGLIDGNIDVDLEVNRPYTSDEYPVETTLWAFATPKLLPRLLAAISWQMVRILDEGDYNAGVVQTLSNHCLSVQLVKNEYLFLYITDLQLNAFRSVISELIIAVATSSHPLLSDDSIRKKLISDLGRASDWALSCNKFTLSGILLTHDINFDLVEEMNKFSISFATGPRSEAERIALCAQPRFSSEINLPKVADLDLTDVLVSDLPDLELIELQKFCFRYSNELSREVLVALWQPYKYQEEYLDAELLQRSTPSIVVRSFCSFIRFIFMTCSSSGRTIGEVSIVEGFIGWLHYEKSHAIKSCFLVSDVQLRLFRAALELLRGTLRQIAISDEAKSQASLNLIGKVEAIQSWMKSGYIRTPSCYAERYYFK